MPLHKAIDSSVEEASLVILSIYIVSYFFQQVPADIDALHLVAPLQEHHKRKDCILHIQSRMAECLQMEKVTLPSEFYAISQGYGYGFPVHISSIQIALQLHSIKY